MSGPSGQTPSDGARRYPGAQGFGDSEASRRLFFGRDREKTDLFHRVMADDLVVIFGRSGHGKSSLIRAGLLQPLRDEGLFPVIARLNDVDAGPLESIRQAVESTARARGLDCEPGVATSLWHYFKTLEVWRGDILLTPVLILDQFEELFTLHDTLVLRGFVDEFASLVRGSPPDDWDQDRELGISSRPPKLKVVLSLRADFLAELEAFASKVPGVFRSRYRVGPLRRIAALEAIKRPAMESTGTWASPTFEWSDDVLDQVLGYLSRGQREVGDRAEVEPFQLQLICQHIEDRVIRGEISGSVEPHHIDGIREAKDSTEATLDEILTRFYERSIDTVAHDAAARESGSSRGRLQKLCEVGLISRTGRRLSLGEEQISQDYKVGRDVLELLVEQRLLAVDRRTGGSYYELSHDTLVGPVLASRHARQAKQRWLWMPPAAVAAVVVLWMSGGLVAGIDNRRDDRLIETVNVIGVGNTPDEAGMAGRLLKDVPNYDANSTWAANVLDALGPSTRRPTMEVVGNGDLEYVVLAADSRYIVEADAEAGAIALRPSTLERLGSAGAAGSVLRTAAISPQGWIVSGFQDSTAVLWRPGGRSHPLRAHSGPVRDARFSPDGGLVVTSSEGGEIFLSDTTGVFRRALRPDATGGDGVYHLDFHPDGRILASATRGGLLDFWRVSDGSRVRAQIEAGARVDDIRFGAGGRILLVLRRGAPSWLIDTERFSIDDTTLGEIAVASFSSDGSRLITLDADGEARVFSLDAGETRVAITENARLSHAGVGSPVMAAILPGSTSQPLFSAVTVFSDGNALLWKGSALTDSDSLAYVEVRHPSVGRGALATYSEPSDAGEAAHSHLITAAGDGSLRMWELAEDGTPSRYQDLNRLESRVRDTEPRAFVELKVLLNDLTEGCLTASDLDSLRARRDVELGWRLWEGVVRVERRLMNDSLDVCARRSQ